MINWSINIIWNLENSWTIFKKNYIYLKYVLADYVDD